MPLNLLGGEEGHFSAQKLCNKKKKKKKEKKEKTKKTTNLLLKLKQQVLHRVCVQRCLRILVVVQAEPHHIQPVKVTQAGPPVVAMWGPHVRLRSDKRLQRVLCCDLLRHLTELLECSR